MPPTHTSDSEFKLFRLLDGVRRKPLQIGLELGQRMAGKIEIQRLFFVFQSFRFWPFGHVGQRFSRSEIAPESAIVGHDVEETALPAFAVFGLFLGRLQWPATPPCIRAARLPKASNRRP